MFELDLFPYEEISTEARKNGRHYITTKGAYPSVTTILSVSNDKEWLDVWKARVGQLEAERIVTEAANRGSKFHELLEDFILNKPIDMKRVNPMTRAHFMQVKKWIETNITKVYGSEVPVYSTKLKCAGRVDAIVEINGKMTILDFKTSKHEKEEVPDYRLQCSAYAYMMNERFKTKIEDYVILISTIYENHPTVFTGNYKDSIKEFAELRNKWQASQTI